MCRILFDIVLDVSVYAGPVESKKAVSWHLLMLACSSCMSCRKESLRAVGITIWEPFKSKPSSEVSSLHMSQYLCVILGACLHVTEHLMWVSL